MAIQPVEQGSAFAFRNIINNNFYELKVLSGASKPTEDTAAVVGQMYLDTSEGKMYFCVSVSEGKYTWKPFASDMSASNVSYDNRSSGMVATNVQGAIDELFTSASDGKELIADAIAGKGVPTSAEDTYATMAENIGKIETGIDISDATLTNASELKKDIVAYSKDGQRIVGSLGQGTVSNPSISVSTAGKITASTSYTSGIIGSSTKSSTYQLSTQAGTTITPGASRKTAVSTGKYTTGTVYLDGDSDLKASNIKSGVNIFGVNGECAEYKLVTKPVTRLVLEPISNGNDRIDFTVPSIISYLDDGARIVYLKITARERAGSGRGSFDMYYIWLDSTLIPSEENFWMVGGLEYENDSFSVNGAELEYDSFNSLIHAWAGPDTFSKQEIWNSTDVSNGGLSSEILLKISKEDLT